MTAIMVSHQESSGAQTKTMYMLTYHCNTFRKVKYKKNYNLSPLLSLKLNPWMDHMDVPWMVSQEWLG